MLLRFVLEPVIDYVNCPDLRIDNEIQLVPLEPIAKRYVFSVMPLTLRNTLEPGSGLLLDLFEI